MPRTFTVRNASETPLLINAYPGFQITAEGTAYPRWSCSAECGVCDFGECGCAPNAVSEVLPGETLELSWSGEYWEERPDECQDGCAIRRTAGEGAYTLSLDFGEEAMHEDGCSGSWLVGDVRTVTVDFVHPSEDPIEVVLPPA